MIHARGILKIDVGFNDDATMDATIDVINQTKIDCSSKSIAETNSLVTFLDAPLRVTASATAAASSRLM